MVRRNAMVNTYYVYAVDRDFGLFFLKFCSYFPFNVKLCLNGHQHAKRQLAKQRYRLRYARQWHLDVRRSSAPAGDLRRST
jgi:hypothetical protein